MEIANKITKFTNLSENDSLSAWDNYAAQQFHGTYEVFYDFLETVKPKRIIEIGTALGGFTNFLNTCKKYLNLDTNILSYDIIEKSWYKDMIINGIDVRIENIFDFEKFTIKPDVINYIQEDGITIILCDGGWKKGEFNVLSNFLKQGDFILAHDYAENKEIFEEKIYGKIWNWLEIQYSDIKNAVERNNLQPYKKNLFENVAWTCWQKK